MQRLVKNTLLACCTLSVMFNFLPAASFEEHKKARMIQDLEVIKHHFEVGYAPAEWKKEYAGWDLEEAFEYSKKRILETPSITTKQFQKILRDFANSMKDYHVDVLFFSTESASLPFSVKGAEGRYFIDWVDPLRLPASYYGIQVGDEVLEFGERPVAEVIQELQQKSGKDSNPKTDRTFAEMQLTIRSGMVGDDVPKGAIILKTRSTNSGQIRTCQLHWAYTPEHIKNPLDFLQSLDFITSLFPTSKKKAKIEIPQMTMANPLHEAYAKKYADHSGGLGARKSFIPLLGETLWIKEENPDDDLASLLGLSINWYAYIYRHPQGESIGYIRIPHYVGYSTSAKEFGEIIQFMEENTDALVIDQVHNFGGIVNFTYALASMLTDKPLIAPYHRMKITQKEVLEAYSNIEMMKLLEYTLANTPPPKISSPVVDEDDAQGEENENPEGEKQEFDIGFNYQELLFQKAYYELVLEEWNQGKTLTRPTPVLGVDRINPHPKYQYTKPILMLIDELDISGGDFMPAILWDNKRALLFGTRTAGAGGCVSSFQFPNSHGISLFSYTVSIAERTNSKKIENLGVTPDIEYQMTVEDLQGGYQGYVEAVNQAVQSLLENPPQE